MARVTVRVPAQLRSLASGRAAVQVELSPGQGTAPTVGEVLAALRREYPGVHDAALDERGAIRQHVNVFAGAENVAFGAGLDTRVKPGVEVWILPAVSGG